MYKLFRYFVNYIYYQLFETVKEKIYRIQQTSYGLLKLRSTVDELLNFLTWVAAKEESKAKKDPIFFWFATEIE